jgi:flagellar assembly protein FliH
MSSRILPSDAPLPVEQVAWRAVEVRRPGSAPAQAAPVPDASAEAALRRQWEQACEQRVQAAHAAGFREGEAAAREQCAAESRAAVERLARTVDEVAALKPRLRREAEADLVRLALAIARRVLHREVAVDPDAMRGVAMAAIEKLKGREIHRVRVHPALAGMLAEVWKRTPADRPPETLSDPSRPPGTLIFETVRGNLDASVDTQLQEIETGLVDRLRGNA